MIHSTADKGTDHRLALALVESDRYYFEMAAETCPLSAGTLCLMPGLTELAASCVIQRLAGSPNRWPDRNWIAEAEGVLRLRKIARARIYLDDRRPQTDELLGQHGYQSRGETGFLAPLGHPTPPAEIELRLVRHEDDWRRKLALHSEAMEGPDGYTNQADLWVEMERRKCATGEMQTYLVYRQDQMVGTVGAILHDGLLRLKNIVVVPRFRRQGIALAIVQQLWRMAEADFGRRLGVFGVTGGKGSSLYRRAGLYAVTEQYEWSKRLSETER